MRILWTLYLGGYFLNAVFGLAQERWQSVPTIEPGQNPPDLIGAMIDGSASRGETQSKARVIVSVARRWGTVEIGIRINDLFKLIPERELWPYTGPDLGPDSANPNMMEITLVSPRGESHFNSRMVMMPGNGFPKGVADNAELLFATNCRTDDRLYAFLADMNRGFADGDVQIGRGVFSPPIEIKFGGQDIARHLQPVMDCIRKSRPIGTSASPKRKAGWRTVELCGWTINGHARLD
jgi:hypothetical protein